MKKITKEKYYDLMLGQAIGDSFLLPYEFLKKSLSVKRIKKYGFKQSLFFGYGVTSDDTDHMLMTAQALFSNETVIDFKQALRKKLRFWLLTLPPGIEITTIKSIIKMWLGFRISGIKSSGNGPLVRVPIIALRFNEDYKKRNEFITASTELTHNSPDSIACSIGIANFIAYLAQFQKLPQKSELINILLEDNSDEIWQQYVILLLRSLDYSLEDFLKEIKCKNGITGYIMHTAIASIYTIYKTQVPEEAFKLIIEASGDTDTVGAIVGSYIGLLKGSAAFPLSIKKMIPSFPEFNNFISKEDLVGKKFWANLIVKNIISIPIIFIHSIFRLLKIGI